MCGIFWHYDMTYQSPSLPGYLVIYLFFPHLKLAEIFFVLFWTLWNGVIIMLCVVKWAEPSKFFVVVVACLLANCYCSSLGSLVGGGRNQAETLN